MGFTGATGMSTSKKPISNRDIVCSNLNFTADYAASKAAAISLDQTLRLELDHQ